ncbi:helix-turn-helix transcriptional regulator [Streptomyces griseorubiginosus]|uniref:response regulator transcription factor n=1 Tax=Streptomyces griseorubiginosus TaxID=67304 RepID=UPI002E811FC8|nr:helix-turn-helix transcriptional regulator [Streptomyces griseorubiginosus]WUB44702.1 helix-turn-helix transcriptional regulator [Streptomyces griseorubiginosus]WUB53219.1 helix-turn-helix transcriptional regulator [Streptomyces griseorubiginosus]
MEISGADARRVVELGRELADAGRPEELWERALTAVLELVPADAGQRYRLPMDGRGVFVVNVPADSFHADPMVIYDHPLDHPLTDLMLDAVTPGAWRVSDVAGDRQWQRTHCYNLDFRPFGLRHHLVAAAGSDTATAVEGYALVRSGTDFTPRERDLLGLVQLQLGQLESQLAERQRLIALSAAALRLAEGHGCGVASLDDTGRPRPLNAVAADLLTALRDDPRLTAGVSFTARHIEVRHLPATPGLPALLLLHDLSRARAVARLFGITEQEHRTLAHLHDGRTATEAAHRMGLSPATVRGYIASLHRKLEAGHTAALLRRGRDLGLLTDRVS